jgi:hypothetical protein
MTAPDAHRRGAMQTGLLALRSWTGPCAELDVGEADAAGGEHSMGSSDHRKVDLGRDNLALMMSITDIVTIRRPPPRRPRDPHGFAAVMFAGPTTVTGDTSRTM